MKPSIQLLKRNEIDTTQWDQLIFDSPDCRLYASSVFLDCMATDWMAMVYGDYEYVMPLPVRNKYKINYVFQPAFCQQLGVFGKHSITQEVNDAMLDAVLKHFKYAELNMHSGYPASKYKFKLRKNYLLSLNDSFYALQKNFSRSANRNISKAVENDISITKHPDASELIKLHKLRYGNLLATDEELENIKKYFDHCIKEHKGHFYYAKDSDGYTIASSGYIQFKNRLVFLMNGNLQEGLDTGAAHLLKEHVIRSFSGKDLQMDFEGSDTASFARFYEQYGATATDNYPFFVFNKLPLPIRWLKQRQLQKANN